MIDLAQPPNVDPASREAFAARDVAVVEGGVVRIPGYSCTFEYEMSSPGDAYACLAETYLFAREGLRDHSVGRASVQLSRALERAARKHGVTPRPLDIRPRQAPLPRVQTEMRAVAYA